MPWMLNAWPEFSGPVKARLAPCGKVRVPEPPKASATVPPPDTVIGALIASAPASASRPRLLVPESVIGAATVSAPLVASARKPAVPGDISTVKLPPVAT